MPIRSDGTKPFGAYYEIDVNATAGTDPVYDYDKNLIVKFERVGSYKPGQYASVTPNKVSKYTKYKVTVINNTTKPFKLAGGLSFTAQDGDDTAAEVFDNTVGNVPQGTLLSGRKISWTVAYGDVNDSQVVSGSIYYADSVSDGLVFSE